MFASAHLLVVFARSPAAACRTKENIMSNGDFARLEGYRHYCQLHQHQDAMGRWHTPMAVAWLDQSPAWNRRVATHKIKALTKKALFYDLVRQRPLLPSEHWLVQGFAHPGRATVGRERAVSYTSKCGRGPLSLIHI
eukprot:984935-Alexandrium_andersonii.AAC.1